MKEIKLPQGYKPLLSIYETQQAIDLGNRLFADKLAGALRLHRVSAPLFVAVSSGLNDDLIPSTPPMWTSGTGRRLSPGSSGMWIF